MTKIYWCSRCEQETPHAEIYDDDYLEHGIECTVCHLVWEASDDLTEEDFVG